MTKPTLNLGSGPDSWGGVRKTIDFHTQPGIQSTLNTIAHVLFLSFVVKAFSHVRCLLWSPSTAMKPTVNLGCGNDAWGDVRIDISPEGHPDILLDFDRYPLPFPDKHFSECRLFHVLEHLNDPERLLREALRTSDVVHAKFPTKYNRVPGILAEITNMTLWRKRRGFWHMLWSIIEPFLSDHPQKHKRTILPTGDYRLNRLRIPAVFNYGRKARVLHKFTVEIPVEWECWIR